MFRVPSCAVLYQRGVLLHNDKLVLDWDRWHLDAQHLGRALCMVPRRRHNMLSGDNYLLIGRDQIATLLDHLGTGHFPSGTVPLKSISLAFTFDHNAALTRTFGHRHRHICRINVTISMMIQSALKILGADQRPLCLDLVRGHKDIRHITRFCSRCIQLVFIHALFSLSHP